MSIYLYELPTTGAISFSDFCVDESGLHTSHISDAIQARANLRSALKESKRDHGERDFLKLVKVRIVKPPSFTECKPCNHFVRRFLMIICPNFTELLAVLIKAISL